MIVQIPSPQHIQKNEYKISSFCYFELRLPSVLNNLDTAQPCTIGVSEVSEVDQALVKEEPTPQVINRWGVSLDYL